MALTEKTRPYETLIRHNPDGSIGAHHQTITEILRDKVVIQGSVNDPIPLNVADGKDGLNLSEVLGVALAEVINANGKLSEQVSELEGIKAQAELFDGLLAEKEDLISDLKAQIELLKVQVSVLSEPVAAAG